MVFAKLIIVDDELSWLCWLTMVAGAFIAVGVLVWHSLKNRGADDESEK